MNAVRLKACSLPVTARAAVGLCLLLPVGCAHMRPGPGQLSDTDRTLSRALAHYAQGLVYEHAFGAGSLESLQSFQAARELDPGEHRLSQHVALGHLRNQDVDQAIETLEASCRLNPNSVAARIDLAAAYQIAGNTEAAARNFLAAGDMTPSNSLPFLAAARLYMDRENDTAAADVMRRAHATVDRPATILAFAYNEGAKLLRLNEPERAIPYFELLADKSDTGQGRFYHLLGEIHETLGETETAAAYFEQAVEAPDAPADAFVRLALIRYEDNPATAVAVLRSGLDRLPGDALVLTSLAYMLNAMDRFEEAVTAFDQVAAQAAEDPTQTVLSARFYLFYGGACERAGYYEKAERIFRDCLTVHPDTHEVMNYLAYMWAEQDRNLDEAMSLVKRALEYEPENAAYLDTLGWIYYRQERYADALDAIKQAYAIYGNDPVIADHLGDVHAALGQTEQAIAAWNLSLSLDPSNREVMDKLLRLDSGMSAAGEQTGRQPAEE